MLQAPALVDGLLFLRDNQEIVCLDVRKPYVGGRRRGFHP
jgi:hypothetical protein